jgi:hypothetical protein
MDIPLLNWIWTPSWDHAEAEIRPHAEFLSEASGEVVTPRGKVFISWKKTEDGLRLETEVPEGIRVVNG